MGVTIVKTNENLIETLASHGLLRSQTPKISQFSGDYLKGDVSFEHWEYAVETLSRVYTESAFKEAITESLKGSAAEALMSLASVAEILTSMKGKYSVSVSYDSLMRDYCTLVKEENKKVPQLATKIQMKMSCIKWRFPQRFVGNIESNALWDRLFFGLKKEIRDSIRFRYNDPDISYSDLLRFARETEVEERGAGSGSKGKTDSKTKAKASSAIVMDSAQTSQGGASSDSDLDNLKNSASKIEEENKKT